MRLVGVAIIVMACMAACGGLWSLSVLLGSRRLWRRRLLLTMVLLGLAVFLTHRGLDLVMFGQWWVIP